MPRKKSNLPAVRKAATAGKQAPSQVPDEIPPIELTPEELRKPHLTLGIHANVKWIPPDPEQMEFIRQGLEKGMTMGQIKKAWADAHTIPGP